MTPRPLRARTLRAYHTTAYRVTGGAADLVARIGQRCPAIDALLDAWQCRHAAFLGAANPGSRRMPDGWNHARTATLAQAVRRHPWLPAVGQGQETGQEAGQGQEAGLRPGHVWAEPHLLVALPAPAAIVLARRFRQAAIVLVRPGQPVRLAVLRAFRSPSAPGCRPAARSHVRWSAPPRYRPAAPKGPRG